MMKTNNFKAWDAEGTHVPWNLNLTVVYHFRDGNHSIFVYKLATTTENQEKPPFPIFNFPKINEEESFQINKNAAKIFPQMVTYSGLSPNGDFKKKADS